MGTRRKMRSGATSALRTAKGENVSKVNIQSTVLSDRDTQVLDMVAEDLRRAVSTITAHIKVAQVLDGTIMVMGLSEADALVDQLVECHARLNAVTRGAVDRVPVVGGHEVV